MKLTWFGGTTIRIHIGGKMIVANPAAIAGVDPEELVSGADLTFSLDGDLPHVDPANWQPARVASMLGDAPELTVIGFPGGAIVAIPGEPPLLLVSAGPPKAGRWGREAIVVLLGDQAVEIAGDILEQLGPRLIALAGPDEAVERTFADLRDRLQGTSLVALEPAMALEV